MAILLKFFSITRICVAACFVSIAFFSTGMPFNSHASEPGLLFYLSADQDLHADYACGEPLPVLIDGPFIFSDGFSKGCIRCPDDRNVVAYSAPGNIYAERGTLSFFFRSRYPLGETPFTLIQASYSDHTSFDMQWMRIDYNGGGYDAFVTDVNLARSRLSYSLSRLPGPDEWTHLALTWDETCGIRLYIDGDIVARKDTTTVYTAGLGFFGTHGYFINPLFIGSGSTQLRGADFDEIRIYDRMLDADQIQRLAEGGKADLGNVFNRSVVDDTTIGEWFLSYGWNRSDDLPPELDAPSTMVRKVEIHDAYDLKQWFWKGCDGIRETTWPGVYNRSRLPGRTDYFPSPDWNCYSLSGKNIVFTMPDEPWNHLEISGAASGSLDYLFHDEESADDNVQNLFNRTAGQERTFHRLPDLYRGGKIRFTNDVQETPIGEFSAYCVQPGIAPAGTRRLASVSYTHLTLPTN